MNLYFDNGATTAQDPRVSQIMNEVAENDFYNSNALYGRALMVKKRIEKARKIIQNKIDPRGVGELIFTSGATESNNMVILGLNPHTHLEITNDEHASIQKPLGARVEHDPKHVHRHLDATQIFCKIPFFAYDYDTVSISAHKINGPKGIGALWVRRGVHLKPLMYGGGDERRVGTENTSAIVGFARAVELWDTEKNLKHVKELHDYFVQNLPEKTTQITPQIRGGKTPPKTPENPYIIHIEFESLLGQTVMTALENEGVIVGIGSACSSKENLMKKIIRVSFSPSHTMDDVKVLVDKLRKVCHNLNQ